MKFVTYKAVAIAEKAKNAGEEYWLKLGEMFPEVYKVAHHPLAPKGRLGFLIGGNVIDVAAASMKVAMRSDEKNLLLPTLPSDIISFLAFEEKISKLAADTYEWCSKRS